jgi:hypothetical protein
MIHARALLVDSRVQAGRSAELDELAVKFKAASAGERAAIQKEAEGATVEKNAE